jgi:hypothetical protein
MMGQSRAQRLAELRDEIARTAGYDSFTDMSGPDRQRAEQAALLKLQHEICAAKLVAGGELVTNELIALNAAIAATLPAVKAKPIQVEFIRGPDPEATLKARIAELEAQVRELAKHAPREQEPRPVARAVGSGNVVVPLPSRPDGVTSWSVLRQANSPAGNPGGILFDESDPSGRGHGKL